VARELKGCDFVAPYKWRTFNDGIARTNASALRLEPLMSAFGVVRVCDARSATGPCSGCFRGLKLTQSFVLGAIARSHRGKAKKIISTGLGEDVNIKVNPANGGHMTMKKTVTISLIDIITAPPDKRNKQLTDS
jgi:hypothetical protein